MATFKTRFRSKYPQRKRHDSFDETFHIDLSREPEEIMKEVLQKIVIPTGSKTGKLNYLNCFVQMCANLDKIKIPLETMFLCLQVPLFHEMCEIRAAGLRAMRHLLTNDHSIEVFLKLQIPLLLMRSLDIVLENRLERIHALRLVRKLININANLVPISLIQCVVAIALDGTVHGDFLVHSCLATLCELGVVNPSLFLKTKALSAIIKNILDNNYPQVTESLLAVLLHLLNDPQHRSLLKSTSVLEQLVAPLTNCHYRFSHLTPDHDLEEDQELRIAQSKFALISVLRSWPGMVYFCHPQNLCLQSLIEMLYISNIKHRTHILEFFYDLLGIRKPDRTNSFKEGVLSADPSQKQESWLIYNGFVVAEAKSILSPIAKHRPNLINNYLAILLLTLTKSGLLEALVHVIIAADAFIAVQATVLLGEILHWCGQLLPPELNYYYNCLPKLIASSIDDTLSPYDQTRTHDAIKCLHKIHVLKTYNQIPHSLFLSQQIHFASHIKVSKSFYDSQIDQTKLFQSMKKTSDELLNQVIKDSQVISTEKWTLWNWYYIAVALKCPNDNFRKLEDASQRNFINSLMLFYKPTSNFFSNLKFDQFGDMSNPNPPTDDMLCLTGLHLIDFLIEAEDSKYIEEFLTDLNLALSQIIMEDNHRQTSYRILKESQETNTIFSPTKIMTSLCQYYFLFIGRLSSSSKGKKFLDKAGITQQLHDIIDQTYHDIYIKLIVSTLDYSKEGFSRAILTKVLTSTKEKSRLYATSFMLVLLRLHIPDFHKWAIELLLTQLCDPEKSVSLAASSILDEACDKQCHLEAMIALRPSLLHLSIPGFLLLLKFLSLPSGFKFLKDANFLSHELKKWKAMSNLKYVDIIESALNESFTTHQHNESGSYSKFTGTKTTFKNLFLPPHMYGQLAQHQEGLNLLLNEDCVPTMASFLSQLTSLDVKQLKATLWALGHIGMTPLGFPFVCDFVPHIIRLATTSTFLSIRGTCFYVIGLFSATSEGGDLLKKHCWETVRRSHCDKCSIVKEFFNLTYQRRHGISVSSTESSEWMSERSLERNLPSKKISVTESVAGLVIGAEGGASRQDSVYLDDEDWSWDNEELVKDRSNSYGGNPGPSSDLRRRSISDLEDRLGWSESIESFGSTIQDFFGSQQNSLDSTKDISFLTKNRQFSFQRATTPSDTISYTSSHDAIGYLTLRDIQRKRVQSLCFQEEYLKDNRLQESSTTNSDNNSTQTNSRRHSTMTSHMSIKSYDEQSSTDQYIGLSVPQDPWLILAPPVSIPSQSEETLNSESGWGPNTEYNILHDNPVSFFHKPEVCLICLWDQKDGIVKEEKDYKSDIQWRSVVKLIRCMSSMAMSNYAEKGLLWGKQRYPDLYKDICLYSEVSHHLANYSFRLMPRRFIQELFLDLSFDGIIEKASKLVNT